MSQTEIIECECVECLTSDELGTGVLIDLCHIDDGAGLLGIAQCAEGFLHIAASWTDCGDHGRLRVTTNALFQQPAEDKNGT